MNLMINNVHDLIHILKTHPEWRKEVKQALFPGVNLEKALKELAEAQQRTEEGLQRLEEAQARNEELMRMLIEAQFQSEQRLNKVEKRLDKVEKRLGNVEKRLDKVELILGNHTKRLARLENKMTDAAVERHAMKERLDKIEQNQQVFKGDIEELKHNQKDLKHNQNDLKGKVYENDFTNKANAIFGRYLKRGHDVRNEVGDHLDDAEDNGQVSKQEGDQVFALDLLWAGKLKSSRQQVILAIEVSWFAEKHDVERAITRAGILRRIGLQALPVVAGTNWVDGLKEEALRKGVVIVNDKLLDKASWDAALAKMS